MTTYLECLAGVLVNRQSAFLLVLTVHVPLFVQGRLYKGVSQEKRKEASPILKFHVILYR
jgi:hypothetical protein